MGADWTHEPRASFRLQSHQVNSDICLSSLLFHHQRQHSHVCTDTTVVWNVLYRANYCKLEIRGIRGQTLNRNGLPFLDMQPELCNTKITWNLTLQTAHLLTLQFLMHDIFRQLRYQHQGNAANHQMHAVQSSFMTIALYLQLWPNSKPEIHPAFRWISANISDLQCINTQRGQVCLSQNQNFVSTWIII